VRAFASSEKTSVGLRLRARFDPAAQAQVALILRLRCVRGETSIAFGSAQLFGHRVSIEQADATQLRFGDASFDTVVSFIMLHHVIDWERAISEAVRVVRPDGVVLGYDLTDTPITRWSHGLDRSTARPLQTTQLRDRVGVLPVDAEIEATWHGLVVRFALTKHRMHRRRRAMEHTQSMLDHSTGATAIRLDTGTLPQVGRDR